MADNHGEDGVVTAFVDKWSEATRSEVDESPKLPIAAILGEAVDLTELAAAHLEPVEYKGQLLPGLSSLASSGRFSAVSIAELRELQIVASIINARLGNLIEQNQGITVEMATSVIRDLRSALSFLLDDGQDPEGETLLGRLREQEAASSSHDDIALVLEGYANLGEKYADELASLGVFDVTLPKQAKDAAQGLRLRSAKVLTGESGRAQREALSLRNRLVTALYDRMKATRRAIRYVFRDHPEIVNKAVSEYTRAANRRARRNNSQVVAAGDSVDLETATEGATSGSARSA